jgi:hypothetical protein
LAVEPAEIPGKLSNVIAYWRAKSGSYPLLSNVALDLLSIPPTSCKVERVFSRYDSFSHRRAIMLTSTSAKLLIHDRITRLKEDIIEASDCLRNWQNKGLIKWKEAHFE